MSQLNRSAYVWVIVVASCLLWAVFGWAASLRSTDLIGWAKQLPNVVTVVGVAIFVFIRWGWKIPWLYPWFVPFPNLNGKWIGTVTSNFEPGMQGETIDPLVAELVVRQTLTHISCVMRTANMRSTSNLAGLVVNAENQQCQLIYTYTSHPKLSQWPVNAIHEGSVVLDAAGSGGTTLTGRYWTTRGTMGDVSLKRTKGVARRRARQSHGTV
jgi:hypothetical protein